MKNNSRHAYTVSDLESLTGINRRTIHFYVKEGVLPAPRGAGGGARYGEEHLLRLQLTRDLQKSHLKLSGIREAMDRLSLEQMRVMAKKAGSPSKPWDMHALDGWVGLVQAPVMPAASSSTPPAPAAAQTWERIRVAEGFEVLLRSDLAQSYRPLVRELAARVSRRGAA